MATQFSDLQKLLINVAADKCDAFIAAHINDTWNGPTATGELPEFTAGDDNEYYNKVVFLKKYNAIYTKGTFFGYNGDLKASFDDLVNDLKTGLTEKGITVKYDADKNKIVTTVDIATYVTGTGWTNADNVVTGTTVQTYVDAKVADAVAQAASAMELKGHIGNKESLLSIQLTANNGDVYVAIGNFTDERGQEIEKGDLIIFEKDPDDGVATYIVVQKNLDGVIFKDGDLTQNQIVVATGTDEVKTTGYVIGGDILSNNRYTLATEAGVTEAISGAIGTAVNNMVHNNGSGHGTYMTYTYHTTYGITYIDSIDPILAKYSVSTNALGETTLDNTGVDGLVDNNVLNTVIGYLDGKINAVDCEVTTLTEVSDSDYFSVTEDSTDKTDNDRNYKIELNVVNLGDAVGMTYDEATGKWSAPSGSTAVNGLASAADVANELVSDEKVIAAALNDHETRIDELESFVNDIDGTIQDQLKIGNVTVNGLTATVAEEGLINATLLANVINALDPWQEYV